jgi:hypothetical protein
MDDKLKQKVPSIGEKLKVTINNLVRNRAFRRCVFLFAAQDQGRYITKYVQVYLNLMSLL